jgi:penicillin-binding protein-related factor A (putative recombinase)
MSDKQQSIPCDCEPFQVCQFCAETEKSEQEIEDEIFQYCEKIPHCLVTKTDTKGNRKNGRWIKSNPKERKGKQDLILCFRGYYIAVEVKKPGEKQFKDQIDFEKEVKAAGGEYWLVKSLDEFILEFKKFRLKNQTWRVP